MYDKTTDAADLISSIVSNCDVSSVDTSDAETADDVETADDYESPNGPVPVDAASLTKQVLHSVGMLCTTLEANPSDADVSAMSASDVDAVIDPAVANVDDSDEAREVILV